MSFSYNTNAARWLEESGISAKYARRAGWKQQQNGWIQLPYFDLDGKPTGFLRYKVFDRGEQKYHQDAKGKHFYFPPWPNDVRKWADIAKNPKRRLIIVEGEKKAACGVVNGLACIGIQGVSSWHAEELAHIN